MFQYCTSKALLYTECGLHSSTGLWDLSVRGSQRCQCLLHCLMSGLSARSSRFLKNGMDTFASQSFCTRSSQTSKIFAESTIEDTQVFCFPPFCFLSGNSSLVNLGMKRGTCCSCCSTSVVQPKALSAQCWVSLHSCLRLLVLLGKISGLLQQNPFFYRKSGLLPNKSPYLGSKQAKQPLSKLTAGSLLVRQVQLSSITFIFSIYAHAWQKNILQT